jgi:hypothetical protein
MYYLTSLSGGRTSVFGRWAAKGLVLRNLNHSNSELVKNLKGTEHLNTFSRYIYITYSYLYEQSHTIFLIKKN